LPSFQIAIVDLISRLNFRPGWLSAKTLARLPGG